MSFVLPFRIIGRAFKKVYEYVTIFLPANLVWVFLAFAPLLIVLLAKIENSILITIAVLLNVFTFGPITAGLYFLAENIVTAQDFSLSTLVTGIKKYFKKSIILTAVNLLIVGILIFNLSISLVSENQFIFYLSFVWIYLLALWGLQVQYNFPLLIKQDSQIFSILKNSFFISLHNFVPSLIITIVNAILINVGVFLVVPMVFFFMAVVAVIQNMMLKEIFDIYDGLK